MDDPGLEVQAITSKEFNQFRSFIYEHAGISMTDQKRQLVASRLHKRLRFYRFDNYGDYLRLVADPVQDRERQVLVDLLTTNETYFFREPAHFDFLAEQVLPAHKGKGFQVWSAACSSGEEVYTLAMVCSEVLGMGDWQVTGSDISTRVLDAAKAGLYPMERAQGIPRHYLSKYCLKGVRSQAGKLLIEPRLKQRVRFRWTNLKKSLSDQTRFDVIFLRNVLIYFDLPTKRDIVRRVLGALKPGGHFIISHVESLHGVNDTLKMVRPSVFRKPGSA